MSGCEGEGRAERDMDAVVLERKTVVKPVAWEKCRGCLGKIRVVYSQII